MKYDLGRYEMKYAIPARHRDAVLDIVGPFVEPDPHAGPLPGRPGRGYVVTSLYFDTDNLQDYTDRLCEANVRNRIRIRTYGLAGPKDPVFLENKRKLDDRVIKARTYVGNGPQWVDQPNPTPWTSVAVTPRNRSPLAAFMGPVEAGGRAPKTLVRYEREVFVGVDKSDPKLRLTLDHDVRGAKVDDARALRADTPIALMPSDLMVMELKFDVLPPAWMRRMCRELRLRAGPVSKFGLSIYHCCRGDRPAELRYLSTSWSPRRSAAAASAA